MRKLLSVALLAVAGCAAIERDMGVLRPGLGVSNEQVLRHCPSVDFYEQRKEHWLGVWRQNKTRLPVPRVGDPACEVLAKIGGPNRSDFTEVDGAGLSYSWWYHSGSGAGREVHLVRLSSDFTVVAVAW
ncbi:MAG: hypothetical protein ACPGVY_16615 [Mycobacterium sp.]